MKLAFRTTISALCLCAVLPVFFAALGQTQSAQDQSNQTATKPATFFKDDFSVQSWGTGPSKYGELWYQDGEYHMRATKGGFIVMYGPRDKEYLVENATVSVAARSVDADPPVSGYGIVVYGEKKKSQLEDYAFLIYSGPNPQYKIVLHKRGVEKVLVNWVPSDAINVGVRSNRLEVRMGDQKLEFSINGHNVKTIADSEGWKRGRVGLYTSQTNEVAFDDLEITRDSNPSESPSPVTITPTPDEILLDPVTTKTDLYPADADAKRKIDEALKRAVAEKKRVLLVFGGNWCYDCHVLDRALHEGAAGKLMVESFLLIQVDIGEGDKNLDLVKKYRSTLDKGVPAVVILQSDGEVLYSSTEGEFEAARRMMKKDLVAFLLQWKEGK